MFMNKRPEDSLAEMVANLKAKTGKSLEEWGELVDAANLKKHGEMMQLLKGQYGVSHGYANQIALNLLKRGAPGGAPDEDPMDALYAGPKAGLKPIHDAVIERIRAFGPDVDLAPKKGYLSVRRNKQFAILQPSTATRLDVGINLKGIPPTDRLEPSGSFNAMLSHRVRIGELSQVDDELEGWLRKAYEDA